MSRSPFYRIIDKSFEPIKFTSQQKFNQFKPQRRQQNNFLNTPKHFKNDLPPFRQNNNLHRYSPNKQKFKLQNQNYRMKVTIEMLQYEINKNKRIAVQNQQLLEQNNYLKRSRRQICESIEKIKINQRLKSSRKQDIYEEIIQLTNSQVKSQQYILRKQQQKHRNQIEQLKRQISKLKQQNNSKYKYFNDVQKLKININELLKKQKQAQMKLFKLSSENQSLKEQIATLNQDYKKCIQNQIILKKKNQNLSRDLLEKQSIIQTLTRNLNKKKQELQYSDKQNKIFIQHKRVLQKNIIELRQNNQKLKTERNNWRQKYNNKDIQQSSKKTEYQRFQKLIKNLQETNRNQEQDLFKKTKLIQQYQSNQKDIRLKLKNIQQSNEKQLNELKLTHNNQIKKLSETIKQATDQINKSNIKQSQSKKNLKNLEQQYKNYKISTSQTISNKDKQLFEVKKQNERLNNQRIERQRMNNEQNNKLKENLKQQCLELKAKLLEQLKNTQKLQKQYNNLERITKEQIEALKQNIQQLLQKIQGYQSQISQKNQQIQRLIQQKDSLQINLKQQILIIKQQNKSLINQQNIHQQRIIKLNQQNIHQQRIIKNLQIQLQKKQKQSNHNIKKQVISDALKNIRDIVLNSINGTTLIHQQTQNILQEITNMEQILIKLSNQIINLQKDNQKLTTSNKQLKKNLELINDTVKASYQQTLLLDNQYKTVIQQIQSVQNNLFKFNGQFIDKFKVIISNVKQSYQQCSNLDQQYDMITHQIQSVENLLNSSLKNQLINIFKNIIIQQKEIQSVESELQQIIRSAIYKA